VTDVRPDAQRVTLQDVADRAGVSLTTASRVVNDGSRKVGQALADRVNRAVADLGYTANLQARAVATGQSTMIGVVLRDISDPYFSSIAAGLIEVAHDGGLLVCMASTAAHEEAEREYVALMRAQRARAVVLVGSRSDNTAARTALRAELAAFTRSGGRAACIGQDLLGVDTVRPENRAGAEDLARALATLWRR
jgi:LacI family transcriptional regulator